ncbi:MAG TPA: ATP phosphoribosyltransferase [Nitrospirae bacterium]|nr:ATP phosphoribosyltransferase [Nitrospirota bacterium]
MINFAIPDGHQMKHVQNFFSKIGLFFDGYQSDSLNKRPYLKIKSKETKKIFNNPESIAAKVIRPQDMPMHVAANNFDIAITGTDWLKEHKKRFPDSPVEELVDMGFGKVKIVAAIHESLPIYNIGELRDFLNSFEPNHYFRIASEYTYIADDYAREHKLYKYSIIMTYGATESLIPEDAEMIIENTETGSTLHKNRLRIIDTLFESEGCLIVNKDSLAAKDKGKIIKSIKTLFETNLS